jgi:hypothetical protein
MAEDCHSKYTIILIEEAWGTLALFDNMAYYRNYSWQDLNLRDDIEKYVKQMLKRSEMLSFLERDYFQYSWGIRSLDRRLRYFDMYYRDDNVSVDQVMEAVEKELDGPGKLLGYRAMQKKIRQEHNLNVPRDLVHAVMYDLFVSLSIIYVAVFRHFSKLDISISLTDLLLKL